MLSPPIDARPFFEFHCECCRKPVLRVTFQDEEMSLGSAYSCSFVSLGGGFVCSDCLPAVGITISTMRAKAFLGDRPRLASLHADN